MNALPKGWVKTTLGELFEITSSKRVHQHEWTDSGVPFYRAREIKKLARDGFVENELFISEELFLKYAAEYGAPVAGDLMVTAVGTLGECYRVKPDDRFYFKDASVLWFRSEGKADSEFIARIFATREVQAQVRKGGGTTVGTYTIGSAKETVVPLPPLAEQKRIVVKLDALNAKSARARTELSRIETLVSRYKQTVLSKAFSGELTKEWRHDRDWPTPVRLGDVAGSFSYGSAAKSQKTGAIPVLRMGNIQDGKLDWRDLVYTDDEDEIAKYRLAPGDVLFNRTNSPALVGKTALYNGEREAIFAGYLIRIVAGPELDARYLTYALNSPVGREFSWHAKTDGVSQSNISASKLKEFAFAVPQLDEQREIVRRIESAFAKIDRLEKESKRALELVGKLDEAILAKAFRGELVPQDENDEPAELLLERIRAERAAAPKAKRVRRAQG